jgi:hypothetical protein
VVILCSLSVQIINYYRFITADINNEQFCRSYAVFFKSVISEISKFHIVQR